MKDLHVSLIQSYIHWEDIDKNLEHFSNKINEINSGSDLILLPEMFPTGFTMNTQEMAQDMNGKVVKWLLKKAREKKAIIAGSVIVEEDNKYYNRLIAAKPDGKLDYYDKRHLFRMAEEHNYFSAGNQKTIINVEGWKINLLVCYDLRFPIWSRNTFKKKSDTEAEAGYDACIYVANWPEARVSAWNTLLKARSIENQCYTLGVNRIGEDGSGVKYNGSSQIVDPKGEAIIKTEYHKEDVLQARLSYEELSSFRKKFPVGLDAD